jgi:hypothetical protein
MIKLSFPTGTNGKSSFTWRDVGYALLCVERGPCPDAGLASFEAMPKRLRQMVLHASSIAPLQAATPWFPQEIPASALHPEAEGIEIRL